MLTAAENKSSVSLRETAEKNPESREVLLQKAKAQDKKHVLVTDKNEFLKVLSQVSDILDLVEQELASHTGGKEILQQSIYRQNLDRFTYWCAA